MNANEVIAIHNDYDMIQKSLKKSIEMSNKPLLKYQEQMQTSLDKGIQGKEAKKVLPTLHKTPPNGTIGGVFVCRGKIGRAHV